MEKFLFTVAPELLQSREKCVLFHPMFPEDPMEGGHKFRSGVPSSRDRPSRGRDFAHGLKSGILQIEANQIAGIEKW